VSNVTALTGSGCAVRIEVENKVTIKGKLIVYLKRFFSFGFEISTKYKIIVKPLYY
jgi:hypothetical protein